MLCLRFSACSVLHAPRPSQDRGKCVYLNSPPHGRPLLASDWLARMRASSAPRLGRQPGDADARGEEKDAQEVVCSKWRRRRNLKILPPLKQRIVDVRERHLSTCGTLPATHALGRT